MKLKELVNREVKIYPGDTYYKYGIIEEVNDNGVLFKITSAHPKSSYTEGKYVFISFSSKLTFEVL